MISALCGLILGTCFGSVCVFLIGVDSFLLAVLVIGTSTVLAAIVAYRFPYGPDVLRLLADWLK